MESNKDQTTVVKSSNESNDDIDFEPSAEMMVHDFDDELTMESEEESEDQDSAELLDLAKEGEMPLEELMSLYYENPVNGVINEITKPESEADENESEKKDELKAEDSPTDDPSYRRSLRSTSVLSTMISDSESDDVPGPSSFCDDDDDRKQPRIGNQYQVSEIPEAKRLPESSYCQEGEQVWIPWNVRSEIVEEYLKEVAKSFKEESQKEVAAGSLVHDNEDALFLLSQCSNNPNEALKRLNSRPQPLRNELHVWSEEECKQFELGLSSYGKDFYLIHINKVKTKSVRDIIKFYYIWKKSERYDHFNAKTRLGRIRKEKCHPRVTDYMDRLLDETDKSLMNSHSSNNYLRYHYALHSTALREHVQGVNEQAGSLNTWQDVPEEVLEISSIDNGRHTDNEVELNVTSESNSVKLNVENMQNNSSESNHTEKQFTNAKTPVVDCNSLLSHEN